MNPKAQFLSDATTRDLWHAVAHTDWFQKVLVHVRAELNTGRSLTPDEQNGARLFSDILETIADESVPDPVLHPPRLDRTIENPRQMAQPPRNS